MSNTNCNTDYRILQGTRQGAEHSAPTGVSSSVPEAALAYYERGFPVIPVGPDKKPIGPWKDLLSVRPTVAQVLHLFARSGCTGVGIPSGEVSGFDLLDFDGQVGLEAYAELRPRIPLQAPVVRTGSGTFHVLFQHQPGQRVQRWLWHGRRAGELRGNGGFALAPPSLHPSGRRYSWEVELTDDFSPMPDELRELILPSAAPVAAVASFVPGPRTTSDRILEKAIARKSGEGRNETGLWLACQLRDNGYGPVEARPVMLEYARRVATASDHPYTPSEALASLSSAFSRPARESWRHSQAVAKNPLGAHLDRIRRGPGRWGR